MLPVRRRQAIENVTQRSSFVVQQIQKENTPPIKLSALEDKTQTLGAVRSAFTVAQATVARRL